MSLARRLLREPLLQFLLLGGALFAASALLRGRASPSTIVVGAPEVAYQRELYRLQFGHEPDAALQERLIDNYVREEALYREAQRLGLGKDDEIVRRRLVAKMEFLLRDSAIPPEPTEAELESWRAMHADRYARPEKYSFHHAWFADGADAARRALRSVRAAQVPRGEPFPPGARFEAIDADEARRVFGQSEFTDALATAPLGAWSGPWRSGFGWHLLYLERREPGGDALLVDVRAAVQADWERDWRERRSNEEVQHLVDHYRVVQAPAGGRP